MAKDNPSKRSGPGTPKTQKTSRPGYKEKQRKHWLKADYADFLRDKGVEGAHQMTKRQLRAKMVTLRQEGKIEDARQHNGPKAKDYVQAIQRIQEGYVELGEELVKITIEDKSKPGSNPTVIELPRTQAALMKLYDIGMKKNNPSALVAFLDRISGKAKQSVEHSGEIKADEQKEPTVEENAAAEAYERALLLSQPSPYAKV